MYKLDAKYKKSLKEIAKSIQESDELSTYLDTEEEDDYKALQEKFEPAIAALHEEVIQNNPLQVLNLEDEILAPDFEGLFIPRILGYSVLRGEINENVKYTKPQIHFRDIIKSIVKSTNFDIIKQRIGQSVQMGFALSSDIWVTNLIVEISNKRIKTFLENLVPIRFRENDVRKGALKRYARQFANMQFYTTVIPETSAQLGNSTFSIIRFLKSRDDAQLSHDSYETELIKFVENKDLQHSTDYVRVIVDLMRMQNSSKKIKKAVSKSLNALRKSMPRFNEIYFNLLQARLERDHQVDAEADRMMIEMLDQDVDDDLVGFYHLMDTMHSKGYIHDDTIEEIRKFYNKYEGLSTINDALRWTVSGYFNQLLTNLEELDYPEYFELNSIFSVYVSLFSNESFNQRVKQSNLSYVKKLLKYFKDKRSKEYQEIKKFVSTSFVDMGFFSEKEVLELFKTRRKKKKVE